MRKDLHLFEHQAKPFAWTDSELVALERLNRASKVDVLRATYRGRQPHLQAKEHVGVIRIGKHLIQILPKIYRMGETTDEQEQKREATRNLLYLLAYAGQFRIREQDIAPLLRRDRDWFEILTRLFASHLLMEWRFGPYRSYESCEDNLPILKGKWRIADQLRRPLQKHAFAVSFDEFTADNHLNQVFNFVVNRLKLLTREQENKHLLGILAQWMADISLPSAVTPAEIRSIHLTRLNCRFEPLLNLARLFIDQSAFQLATGDQKTFAFVFDMNALYEAFVVNFIRRHRGQILPISLATCELLPQTRGAARHLAVRHNNPVIKLKPDLSFRSGGTFPLILDTKYKLLSPLEFRRGVSQADFYQMFAYAKRYNCPRVILLYPQTADLPEGVSDSYQIENGKQEIRVETLDIRTDLSSKDGKDQIIQQLKDILEAQREPDELAR